VGQGRATHTRDGDELATLAGVVVAGIRPHRQDRDDCRQAAYVAGLMARRSAERSHQHTSRRLLELAMREAVYRLLRQPKDTLAGDLQMCA
jgi:hypothetical protein